MTELVKPEKLTFTNQIILEFAKFQGFNTLYKINKIKNYFISLNRQEFVMFWFPHIFFYLKLVQIIIFFLQTCLVANNFLFKTGTVPKLVLEFHFPVFNFVLVFLSKSLLLNQLIFDLWKMKLFCYTNLTYTLARGLWLVLICHIEETTRKAWLLKNLRDLLPLALQLVQRSLRTLL